jgi:nitrate reductase delta subunit
MMGDFAAIADALRYPAPGRLEALRRRTEELADTETRAQMAAFVDRVSALSLAEWEELHTRTLDLSPAVAPYVGHAVWGETYERGKFMALLNQALTAEAIDAEGELPDHLIPVLRYLDVAAEPLPEVVQRLAPALERMRGDLKKVDPDNAYLRVIDAARATVRSITTGTGDRE